MCEELGSSWHQDRGPEQGVQVPPPHVSFTSVRKRQTCLLALTSVFFMLPIEFRNTNTGLDKYKHMQVQNAPTCTGIFTSDLLGGGLAAINCSSAVRPKIVEVVLLLQNVRISSAVCRPSSALMC